MYVYLRTSLTYKNVLANLELDNAHLLKILVKLAKFTKKILNLSSFNSTQFQFEYTLFHSNKKIRKPTFRLPKGPKIMFKGSVFRLFSLND